MAHEKAIALLEGIAQVAREQRRRDEAMREADVVVIRDEPGVIQFIGWASEPKPETAPEPARRSRWWPRWPWRSRGY